MKFLQKLRYKYGRFAIKGLTRYIIATYVLGYILMMVSTASNISIMAYLSLNPGAIMHGQIWRLFTWVLAPPTSISIFTVIMLICYYQLGTILERVWGDFFYNLFIFFGLFMTVVGAFISYYTGGAWIIEGTGGMIFSTYYVSLSIFLAFALTFPEQRMLLFFIIPIKIKYLAIFDVAYLVYDLIRMPFWAIRIQVIASVASIIIMGIIILVSKMKLKKRKSNFSKAYDSGVKKQQGKPYVKVVSPAAAKNEKKYFHKCAICGQTDIDNPKLEFRYCSKCNGSFEYCQNHLFTHEHVK